MTKPLDRNRIAAAIMAKIEDVSIEVPNVQGLLDGASKAQGQILDAMGAAGPNDDHLIVLVAKAIEGPHLPVPDGRAYSLEQLREVRWRNLNDQERASRLNEAKSAIEVIVAVIEGTK